MLLMNKFIDFKPNFELIGKIRKIYTHTFTILF